MNFSEAYDVLYEYYPRDRLQQQYKRERFDNSGTDTVKIHKYHAELLRKQSYNTKNKAEKDRLSAAAKVFEELYE